VTFPGRFRRAIPIIICLVLLAGAAYAADAPQNATAKNLAKEAERLRAGLAGKDPVVVAFLDKIERGEAVASDLNAFATYLAKKGLAHNALPIEQEAVRLDPKNSLLWLNVGTLQRDLGHRSEAMSSYKKSLTLDPNNALTHYNIGALLDAEGSYDAAIESYRTALTLDPTLADPRKNPQILNNRHQTALSILVYRQKAGALGLPLVPVAPTAKPALPEAPR
jgi:tetratricopeptide (TPR) repeat protein